jgi:hypothetical protein
MKKSAGLPFEFGKCGGHRAICPAIFHFFPGLLLSMLR